MSSSPFPLATSLWSTTPCVLTSLLSKATSVNRWSKSNCRCPCYYYFLKSVTFKTVKKRKRSVNSIKCYICFNVIGKSVILKKKMQAVNWLNAFESLLLRRVKCTNLHSFFLTKTVTNCYFFGANKSIFSPLHRQTSVLC